MKIEQKPHYLGHRKRVKAKFLQDPKNFVDYELLELLLFFSHSRKDVKPLAKELLAEFGSINAILKSSAQTLKNFKNINENVLVSLSLIEEIITRSSKQKIVNKPIIDSWQQLVSYCKIIMADLAVEQFRILFLDKKHCLITDELLKIGNIDNVEIDIREIIKKTINCSASSAILLHNHPNNSSQPSKADIEVTKKIADALQIIKVKVYDHLIIGENGEFFSFKNEGLLL
jgi:DNA repair protein RadC